MRVRTRKYKIFADATGNMNKWTSGEGDPRRLESTTETIKEVLVKAFDEHYDFFLYNPSTIYETTRLLTY